MRVQADDDRSVGWGSGSSAKPKKTHPPKTTRSVCEDSSEDAKSAKSAKAKKDKQDKNPTNVARKQRATDNIGMFGVIAVPFPRLGSHGKNPRLIQGPRSGGAGRR